MSAGRRTSLASLAGAKVEKVPGHSDALLVRLPAQKVVPTPLNPRTDFGSAESLAELGESMRRRQLQPVVVVARSSYLKLFPEHTEQVGTAAYVIANGERRYRAARHVDLALVECVVREEVATSRADFLDAVLSENIDRKNFDPIEEAHAVQAMVKECGTATAAAKRFGRTGAWVSQRLALLRLVPDVQMLVRNGTIPVREARDLAALPEGEQAAAWRQRQQQRQEAKSARKESRPAPVPGQSTAPPATVRQTPTAAAPSQKPAEPAGERSTPATGGGAVDSVPSDPAPQPAETLQQQGQAESPDVWLWENPAAMAARLAETFDPEQRRRIAHLLMASIERDEAGTSVPA